MRQSIRSLAVFPVIALLLIQISASAFAQARPEQIEAAYLAKFARYVSWPQEGQPARGSMQLCIVGNDPFGRMIDQAVAGETIGGRAISVRRVSTEGGAAGCHIAYVHGSDENSTRSLLNSLEEFSVLTVTSARSGPTRGMVHFIVRDKRVRFYIDDYTASRHGLSISSRLLALAVAVRRRGLP